MRQNVFLYCLLAVCAATLTAPLSAGAGPALANDFGLSDQSAAPPTPTPIQLESPDREIATRLNGLFADLEGVEQIRAQVRGGVVTLTGTVLSAGEREKAEAVASRLAGVVSVENEIQIEHRISRRVEPIITKSNEFAQQTIAFIPLLLVALVAFLAVWLLGRLLTTSRVIGKIAPNPLVQVLVAQAIRLAFIVMGLVLAMRIMGATALLGTVLGAAGVFGLAVGFAIRDTIENYIASILLSIRRPFSPNDHVILEGYEGRVTRLNSRATFLTTLDGNEVRIPNAIVYKAMITNFSAIPERRFEFLVGIGYENDLCHALATAWSAVKTSDGVLRSPEPVILIDSLDPSTISLKVLGWVDQRTSDHCKVRSVAIRSIKTAFDNEAISMPAPIQIIQPIDHTPVEREVTGESSAAESGAVSDTSADHTIEGKVNALRAGPEEDLLTTLAPRE